MYATSWTLTSSVKITSAPLSKSSLNCLTLFWLELTRKMPTVLSPWSSRYLQIDLVIFCFENVLHFSPNASGNYGGNTRLGIYPFRWIARLYQPEIILNKIFWSRERHQIISPVTAGVGHSIKHGDWATSDGRPPHGSVIKRLVASAALQRWPDLNCTELV